MPSIETVKAARAAVRAKLDAEGLDIVSVGIRENDDKPVLRVGVSKCPGGLSVRRQIAGVVVEIYETDRPTLHSKKSTIEKRRRASAS